MAGVVEVADMSVVSRDGDDGGAPPSADVDVDIDTGSDDSGTTLPVPGETSSLSFSVTSTLKIFDCSAAALSALLLLLVFLELADLASPCTSPLDSVSIDASDAAGCSFPALYFLEFFFLRTGGTSPSSASTSAFESTIPSLSVSGDFFEAARRPLLDDTRLGGDATCTSALTLGPAGTPKPTPEPEPTSTPGLLLALLLSPSTAWTGTFRGRPRRRGGGVAVGIVRGPRPIYRRDRSGENASLFINDLQDETMVINAAGRNGNIINYLSTLLSLPLPRGRDRIH